MADDRRVDLEGLSSDTALEEIRQHSRRMQVLYRASQLFAEEVTDPERLIDTIARTCCELVGDFSAVTLVRDDREWMDQIAVHHPDPEFRQAYLAISQSSPVRIGEGVMGRILKDDEPLLLPEVDPEVIAARAPAAYRDAARRLNVCSFVGVPMHARGRVIGGISMARNRPGAPYSEADLAYLQDLADRAALALENARLYAALERRVAEATAQLQAANQRLRTTNASLQAEIAERQRTEEALRQARGHAEDVSREFEAFSYSVAHDLRAPVRAIGGFSHALLEDCGDALDDDGRRHLERVAAAAQHMGQVIDGLLSLARMSRTELRRQRVDLSDLARGVLARLQEAEPERQVELAIEEGLFAEGDPRLLDVVLTNLLGNAWKFTSKRALPRIQFAASCPQVHPVYFVRDNGAGFDPAHAERLFGVFQRLHAANEFEGTGIGLVTVQRIILRHGGRVWAEGAPDQGATFFFTLGDDS